jgi:hypothetical protein
MPSEDEMTIDERRKYLKKQQGRYRTAKRKARGQLLQEMEQVTGLHRKSLTRLMNASSLERTRRRTPRQKTYGKETEQVIVRVWESLDYVCAERLTPVLLSTAQQLARFGEVQLSAAVEEQVQQISRATVGRLLRAHRSQRRRLPQKGAERANQATAGVPMGRIPWDIAEAGHAEVDLVHHGGESTAGEYAHTLQLIDVKTGWSERVALRGRGYEAMKGGFERVLGRLPFPLKEVHPDNGSEFFNHHLRRFLDERLPEVQLSRSRPYHKNDNRYVEQKNDTLVRHYFGTLRLETPAQVEAMNRLYERLWLYYNFFQPVLHLSEKQLVGDRVKRHWDQAQTPFERLKACGVLSEAQQARLQALYDQTNPLALRREIYRLLDALWAQATAPQEDVA